MSFNPEMVEKVATKIQKEKGADSYLVPSFVSICKFLSDYNESLSWRGKSKPSLESESGINVLAERYFESYIKSDYPVTSTTVPDKMVGLIMKFVYGYDKKEMDMLSLQHQQIMCVENSIGALLERYIFSVLWRHGWCWCCGNFVRKIDFIKYDDKKKNWLLVQIKNRDNSENSSSSSVRKGTEIIKWFRTFSRTGKTNWDNLPDSMKSFGLNEEDFISFVKSYLEAEKSRH